MKEQKKSTSKVIVRSALILLLLTLISGCFLGSTFARYVSKGEGDLSGEVAKWSITETSTDGTGTAAVDLGDFSPNMNKYNNAVRTRSLSDVGLFKITNEGDVDAFLYLTIAGASVTPASDDTITTTVTAYGYDDGGTNASTTAYVFDQDPTDTYEPSSSEFAQVFAITATVTYSGSTTQDQTYYILKPNDSIKVSVNVTWTSDLSGDNENDKTVPEDMFPEAAGVVYGDLRDTWIGENIAAVGFSYSWYALQGSELPASGATNTPNP